jgi:type IV pilus assembly protein PilW
MKKLKIMPSGRKQSGVSLVELMIAIALGLVLILGLTTVYLNSSRASKELQRAGQQIENGRYALEVLSNDLRHAGFFGELGVFAAPTVASDPCSTAQAALLASVSLPLQVYRAANLASRPDLSTTTCTAGLLANANVAVGSDIIVVRRADTTPLAVGDVAKAGEVYVQANSISADIQFGNNAAITAASMADGATAATIKKKDGTAAIIRKFHVHVYFVAPCRLGSGAGGICTNTDDSIPTLKMLALQVNPSTGVFQMMLVPLVAGIEVVKAELGIDDTPTTVNQLTGLPGDAIVDSYSAAPSIAQMGNAISGRVFVLARNTESTPDYADQKSYQLGTVAVLTKAATNDTFKRHLFVGEVMLSNMGGRKEIPL